MSQLPSFPLRLTFDPAKSEKLAPVLAVPVAWRLWLLWKPRHVVNQLFDDECIGFGMAVAAGAINNPVSAKRHYFCAGATSNFQHGWSAFIDEAWPYLIGDVPIETVQEAPNN